MGYIYQADVYCDACGLVIIDSLPMDVKNSGDSDQYPQKADVAGQEADYPQHCADCREFFANPLTPDGYVYVKEILNNSGATCIDALPSALGEQARFYGFDYDSAAGWYSDEEF
jgi:hypothetical protein